MPEDDDKKVSKTTTKGKYVSVRNKAAYVKKMKKKQAEKEAKEKQMAKNKADGKSKGEMYITPSGRRTYEKGVALREQRKAHMKKSNPSPGDVGHVSMKLNTVKIKKRD